MIDVAKKHEQPEPPTAPPDGTTPLEQVEVRAATPNEAALAAENERLAAELALVKEQNAALLADNAALRKAAEPPPPPPKPAPGTLRRAKVRVPGTHFGELTVSFPADAPNPTLAAIEAAKAARGIVSFGAGPEVELLD